MTKINIKFTMMATNSIIIANLPDWASTLSNGSDKEVATPDSPSGTSSAERLPSTFLESLRAVIEVHRDIVHWVPVRRYSSFNGTLC
jgi:hypothetical protein